MEKNLERSIEEKIRRIKACLDGVLSPEEEVEFLRWMDSSPKNRSLLERVRDERVLLEKFVSGREMIWRKDGIVFRRRYGSVRCHLCV